MKIKLEQCSCAKTLNKMKFKGCRFKVSSNWDHPCFTSFIVYEKQILSFWQKRKKKKSKGQK